MVRIGVAALATVMVAMNWRLLSGQWDEQTISVALFSIPGLVLLGGWLVRLLQWSGASRARSEFVDVTPCLARSPQPSGGRFAPVTQSVWMVIRSGKSGKDRRYQRVSWEPWLSALTGPVRAELRAGSTRVAVLDIAGRGRLWPTSKLLRTPPRGVELADFARATSPRTRGGAIARMSLVLALLLIPCVGIGSLWGIAYLATFAFAGWLWFGLIPPGWLPGRE